MILRTTHGTRVDDVRVGMGQATPHSRRPRRHRAAVVDVGEVRRLLFDETDPSLIPWTRISREYLVFVANFAQKCPILLKMTYFSKPE